MEFQAHFGDMLFCLMALKGFGACEILGRQMAVNSPFESIYFL